MKRRKVEESWEEEDDEEEESFGATPEIANFARFPVDGQEDKQNTAQLLTAPGSVNMTDKLISRRGGKLRDNMTTVQASKKNLEKS